MLLSNVGQETLIKVVTQAAPTYTMSCFKFLESLCRKLGSMISRFWWGQKNEEENTLDCLG